MAGTINALSGTREIYFDSLSVLVFLLLVGRWFQARQQRWADEAVGLLGSFTPSTCRVVRGETLVEIPTGSLVSGDIVEVRPGDLIPADGTVVEGTSTVDRSLLSGESVAVHVEKGGEVFAGTQNIASALRVRIAIAGAETRVAQLMELVSDGLREKSPIVQLTDRAAGWFVTAVILAAGATFAAWAATATLTVAVDHTIALLIVACPCALGLATPLTMAVAIGLAARRHMLIKNAAVLEVLAGDGQMLIDKTGTITRGRPTLVEWVGPEWLQSVVAQAESHSSHPIALRTGECTRRYRCHASPSRTKADPRIGQRWDPSYGRWANAARRCARFLDEQGVALDGEIGEPIARFESAGLTTVGIVLAGKLQAIAALGDQVHRDSAKRLASLRQQGWHTTIVSGDAVGVVRQVATEVGVPLEATLGEVLPEEKLALVRQGTNSTQSVVMIGDGVNDAAALAAADVGIAVDGGAEASLAAADVYIASPGLMPIVDLVSLAKRTKRVVRRNLALALCYNLLAVSLAAAGYITPLVAAILMPISSATVLASAMSITFGRQR